jgi:ABC-2 type transport system permease protein
MKEIYGLALKRLWKQKIMLVVLTIFPMIVLFIPPTGNMTAPQIAYGLFGLIMLFSSILLSKQMIDDRSYKTIIRIAASPISHMAYLCGHLLAYFMIMAMQILMFAIVAHIVYDLTFYFTGFGMLMIFAFSIFSLAFALFWHTLYKRFSTSISIYSVVANVIALVGGLTFPLSMLPQAIKDYAIVLPTYWYAYGIEQVVSKDFLQIVLSFSIILGFSMMCLILGSRRRFD